MMWNGGRRSELYRLDVTLVFFIVYLLVKMLLGNYIPGN